MVKSVNVIDMFGLGFFSRKRNDSVIVVSPDTKIIQKKPKYEVELTIHEQTIRLSFPFAKNTRMARDYAVKYANEKYGRDIDAFIKIYNHNEKEAEQSFKTF